VALKFASPYVAGGVQIVTALVVLACGARAVADRGAGQAFAAGFAVCAIIYWLVMSFRTPFFLDDFGTDRLGRLLYDQIVTTSWVDNTTGEVFDYDPSQRSNANAAASIAASANSAGRVTTSTGDNSGGRGGMFGGGLDDLFGPAPFNPPQYSRRRTPENGQYNAVARCLWTLLIGYAGGSFARSIYERSNKPAAES
jgi:hypothetical protein